MAIRPMILLPDPILRRTSDPVERVDDELRRLADDMLETMYDAPGIGLAAIQVGVPRRLIVMDIPKARAEPETDDGEEGETTEPVEEERDPVVLVNPEIVRVGDRPNVYEEGCLSIPEYFAEVERPASVVARWSDLDGNEHERELDGLWATCIQHEMDHLDGTLFIDHISRLRRDRVVKKFVKMAREAGRPLGGERPILA